MLPEKTPHGLEKRAQRRRVVDRWFGRIGMILTVATLGILAVLLLNLAMNGLARIDWQFLTSFPSRRAAEAGILSAWVGTLLLMLVTAAVAIPFGIAAGIYLEEYAPKNRWTDFIEINIANLAGKTVSHFDIRHPDVCCSGGSASHLKVLHGLVRDCRDSARPDGRMERLVHIRHNRLRRSIERIDPDPILKRQLFAPQVAALRQPLQVFGLKARPRAKN